MADPLSIAGSVVGIAAAGFKVSTSLFALVETVSTASERVESIANDISSTCGILNQLRYLIMPQSEPNGTHTYVFNSTALSDISSALYHCQSIFSQVKKYLERATGQVKDITPRPNFKIKLSRSEKAKWPFLQPQFHELRNDLRDSKTNLLLMVAVANLAVVQRNPGRQIDEQEQTEMKATIVRLQRAGTQEVRSLDNMSEVEKENRLKRLLQKFSFWKEGRKKDSEDNVDDNQYENSEKHAGAVTQARQVTPSEATREQRQPTQPPVAVTDLASQNRLASQTANPSQTKYSPSPGSLLAEVPLEDVSAENSEGLVNIDAVRPAITDAETVQEDTEGERKKDADELVAENATTSDVEQGKREAAPDLLDKSTPYQQGPLKEESPRQSKVIDIDEPKLSSASTKAKSAHEFLQAWIFNVLPGLSSGFGTSLDIIELTLPETEIRALLQKQEAQHCSPLETLHRLNSYQRHLVLAHIDSGDSKLLHVDVWHKESIPTVFGLLDVVTLIWITSSTERRETSKNGAIPIEPTELINFKDAVGRKFTFPYHLVRSWKYMEELIKQAFLHVDVIGPHVHQGHYDLVGPGGQIILPQVWESIVRPGWDVNMQMWPMPEPAPPVPPQPEFLPPPPPPLDAQQFMSSDLPPKKGSKSQKTKKRESAHVVQVPPPPPGEAPPPPPPPGIDGALPLPPGVAVVPWDGPKKPRKKPQPSPFFRWAAGGALPRPPGVTVVPWDGPKKPRKKPQPSPFFRWAAGTIPTNEDEIVEKLLLNWTVNEEE